ncbi:hypothetical protein KI387_012214, partial [Taxus chinensis]
VYEIRSREELRKISRLGYDVEPHGLLYFISCYCMLLNILHTITSAGVYERIKAPLLTLVGSGSSEQS